VRRSVAAVLALSLISASSAASWLHLHASADHDHLEHRHGLSAHSHVVIHEPHESDELLRLEPCDPAQHVVRVSLFETTIPLALPQPAALGQATEFVPPQIGSRATSPREVRSHGPPLRNRLIPRAPPA
jgi:hypothetical protein